MGRCLRTERGNDHRFSAPLRYDLAQISGFDTYGNVYVDATDIERFRNARQSLYVDDPAAEGAGDRMMSPETLVWTTRGGKTVPLDRMGQAHLENCIRMVGRQLSEAHAKHDAASSYRGGDAAEYEAEGAALWRGCGSWR